MALPALEEAGYIIGETLLDAGSSKTLTGGVALGAAGYLGNKRLREETGLDISEQVQRAFKKKGSVSRPQLEQLSRQNEISRMGLLTYQRQVNSRRGRSRRRVRRLARNQKRAAFKGSSSNLIANVYPVIFPATAGATREGGASHTYLVPSLAQVVEEVSRVWAQSKGTGDRLSGSFNISIPKQRFQFTWTPDWPNHTTAAVAIKLTIYKFNLSKKCPINDVIATPLNASATAGGFADMCYYYSDNYVGAVPSCGNGLPYDHTEGILSRYSAATNAAVTPSATEYNDVRKDPLTIFESPSAMSKLNFKWMKDFYIPYGQSMSFSCGHGPVRINYPDLEINRPEKFAAKTVNQDGDNFITPFLPAGWPVFIIKVQRHVSSATNSLTNPLVADAINVSHRLYYRVPNFPGRMLTYFNPNSTSRGDGTTVPRYSNISGATNGAGKPSAYTGLNI